MALMIQNSAKIMNVSTIVCSDSSGIDLCEILNKTYFTTEMLRVFYSTEFLEWFAQMKDYIHSIDYWYCVWCLPQIIDKYRGKSNISITCTFTLKHLND